jgi:deoxyribodipyrimidine photolyase-related protein
MAARNSTAARADASQPRAAPRAAQGRLIVLFGDQLDLDSRALRELDRERDTVLMMEVSAESTHVASHVQRTVLFLSAMRHTADALRQRGVRVRYITLDDPQNTQSFDGEVSRAVSELRPRELVCTHPGEWRVLEAARRWPRRLGVPLTVLPDEHFIISLEEFADWARNRRSLVLEFFYRAQRRRTGYLMSGLGPDATPEGGAWNFDRENRRPFPAAGPATPPPPPARFRPDATTLEVIRMVRGALPRLPGRLDPPDAFGWPVTRAEALTALRDFISHRLVDFGPYEDAMWTNTPFVFHSTLSPALNLKLLQPRECCEAAIEAWRLGRAPLQSVEAFIRQLIGWREFIRGVYWLEGPEYGARNALNQHAPLPELYWTAQTEMACMRECLTQVRDLAFGHHIQRLMVTGNFALLSGVHPKAISDWYLGMYVDGVEWATLPNTLGMVMHADRRQKSPRGVTGVVGTKPYAAGGRYIQRMSNYCRGCVYDPETREGPRACPFTTFYWDFLIRNRAALEGNQRMAMALKNVDRLTESQRTSIAAKAAEFRRGLEVD